MTVNETARSFGLLEDGSMYRALVRPAGELTAIQAVTRLGRGVHAGVARQLVLELVRRGVLRAGLTYGSAYSGIDTFAAGVEEA